MKSTSIRFFFLTLAVALVTVLAHYFRRYATIRALGLHALLR